MSFKVIETQEELDNIVQERLDKVFKKHKGEMVELEKKFEGYLSPEDAQKLKASYEDKEKELNGSLSSKDEKYKEIEAKLAEANKKISGYELDSIRLKVALSNGIPYELAGKLEGKTEKELTTDAKKLASFMGQGTKNEPRFNPSDSDVDGVEKAFLEKNPGLKI